MTDGLDQWSRLADPNHLRRTLVDLSAFLVAYAALTDYCVRAPHGFLSEPESIIPTLSERDQRIARSDPDHPMPDVIDDAIAFFVDGGAFTTADADQIRTLGRRREEVVRRAQYLLAEDTAGEFLAATLELRDLLRKASRWWFFEIEAAVQPAILQGADADELRPIGGVELILDFVLQVAQATAEPGS